MRAAKIFFLLIALFVIQSSIIAQSSLNYTTENTITGSLITDNLGNAINTSSATNLVNNWVSNQASALQPIGFDLMYMGKYYSHYVAAVNGCIALGISNSPTTMFTASAANDLTRMVAYPPTSANNAPVIAPFWDKMTAAYTGATIRSVLTGNAPNRCRVIEWNNIINNGSTSNLPVSGKFQLRIYEGSGIIEYVYGNMAIVASSTTVTASIGFTAGTMDNQFLALQNLSSFPFTAIATLEPATQSLVNSTAVGDISGLNSTTDGLRRVLKFTPPVLSGSAITGFQTVEIGATNISLKWDDTYSNELGYAVLVSSDNINFSAAATLAANATSYAVGNLTLGNNYYFKVLAFTEGANAASNVISATTVCALNGIYSIGSGGNYTSLSKAVDSIKIKGVSGNVVFELLNNYNSSSEVFPISFPKIAQVPCLANYKITVRPAVNASNISISGASNNPLILLDSVNYVTIDGRPGGIGSSIQLSIINNNAAPVIRFSNASNNKLLYLKIGGGITGTSIYEGVVNFQGSKASGSDNNKLEQCEIFSAAAAPDTKTILLYSSAASGFENNNDSIINCRLYDFSNAAISLTNFSDGWVIQSNSFYNSSSNINYRSSVSVVKIYALASVIPHQVSNNYFGGMAALGQGNMMQVAYKGSFSCVDALGKVDILNNSFTRMRFVSGVDTSNAKIRFINIEDFSGNYIYNIIGNQIGSANLNDSLHFTQSNFDNNMNVTGIFVNAQAGSFISNNQINQLRCYSTNGNISLNGILVFNGLAAINNNIIGSPAIANSIINYCNAPTTAISAYSAFSRINNNTISRISALSGDNQSSITGIYTNGGTLDSICFNKIFHLKNGNGAISNSPVLTGISASTNSGGYQNLIGSNQVYSLVNNCTEGGGTVIGIQSNANINIMGNFVRNLYSLCTSNITSVYGILIPNKYSVLENNMVSLGLDSNGNSLTAGNLYFAGISGGELMKHNSVFIGGNNVEDGFMGSACFLFLGNALPTNNMNNIFFNARSNASAASSAKHQCANIDISYSCDYNLYYYSGTGGIMGTFLGNRYTSIADWRTGSGRDLNSIFIDPSFIAPTGNSNTINLHLNYGSPAEGAGWSAYTSDKDFDMENRNFLTPVDIGADAGNYANCPIADAGWDYTMFEGGSIQLGSAPISNVQYLWTAPGFTSTIANPVVSPVVNTLYVLKVSSGNCVSYDTVMVNVFPAPPFVICPGGSTSINANIQGNIYQWQVNTGNGYDSLSNNSNYSGVHSNTLQLMNIPSSFFGYKYRCLVDTTTDIARVLRVENVWTGAVNNLWSNTGNWSCGALPDGNTVVYISSGTVVLDVNGICRSIYVAPGASFTVSPGVTLTVTH